MCAAFNLCKEGGDFRYSFELFNLVLSFLGG